MAFEDVVKGVQGAMQSTLDSAKKLKLGVLDLVPAFIALARGEGLAKAAFSAIKWTALSAVIPLVSGVGLAFFSLTKTISAIVRATGSLDAALRRIGQISGLEKVFDPLLKGADAAKERVADLVQFSENSPFELQGVAEASKALELLGPSSLAFGAGLKSVGDVAAATGNDIKDIAGELGMLNSQLKSGADISGTVESLRNMGVVSQLAATNILRLNEAGAGMSLIWGKVREEMGKSAGGIARANEEIGGLQGKLEKVKESLRVAFGQPFVDAEKTGIKNSIKTMENLKPALEAVANALSKVTDATSNITSGFTAWATSIPHLSDLMGGLTRMITNFGVVIAGAGALAFANRIRTIGTVVGELRTSYGLKTLGDNLLASSKTHSLSAKELKVAAMEAAAAGDAPLARQLGVQAKLAGVRGAGARVGAALTGDLPTIGAGARAGVAAAGRLLLSPWFVVPALVAGAISAIQSINDAHRKTKEAVDQINKAGQETTRGLDDQISKITTLDDKYRAIVASTNAIAAARAKLAEIKLPSDDHHLNFLLRIQNAAGKIPGLAAFRKSFREMTGQEALPEKQVSLASSQQKALEQQIKGMEARRDIAAAVPEENLVTERNIKLAERRAVFTRETEDIESERRLQVQPTPAARRAVLMRQAETFTGRAQAGEAEAENFEAAEQHLRKLDNNLTAPLQKFDSANKALDEAAGSNDDIAKRNEAMNARAKELMQIPGTTMETAIGTAAGEREEGPTTAAEEKTLRKIIQSEHEISDIRKEQANLRRTDLSELQQITQALDDIVAHKPARVMGEEVGKEDVGRLAARRKLLQVDIEPRAQEEAKRTAREKTEQAEEERKRSAIQAPDIEAEREILNIRSEGLDREEEMSRITDDRNEKKLLVARRIRAEEEQRTGVHVPEEEDPHVREVRASEEENRRRKAATADQRKQLEFSRKSLEIETKTGRGPDEEIKSLDAQIALNKEEMAATRTNQTLGKQERAEKLASLAKQQSMMEKAKSDIKFNRDQELEAAKSVTDQIRLQSEGNDFLADIEQTRIGYVQRIAQAYRDGNDALGEQLLTQGRLNIAQQLGHKELGDLVRDERTGNLRELNGMEQAQRQRDQQAIKEHARREQAVGQARIASARNIIAKGGSTTDTEALAAIKAEDDMAKAAEQQKLEKAAEQAKQEQIAQEAQASAETKGAQEAFAEGKSLSKAQEKALKVEAAPFKEALGESEGLLKEIRDALRLKRAQKPEEPAPGAPGGGGAPGGQGGPGAPAPAAPTPTPGGAGGQGGTPEPMPTPGGGAEGPGAPSGIPGPGGKGQYPTAQEAWYNREKEARAKHAAMPEVINPPSGLTSKNVTDMTPEGYRPVVTGPDRMAWVKNPYRPSAPPPEHEKQNIVSNIPGGSAQDVFNKMYPGGAPQEAQKAQGETSKPMTPEQQAAYEKKITAHTEGLKEKERLVKEKMSPTAYEADRTRSSRPPSAYGPYVPSEERTAAEKAVAKEYTVPPHPVPPALEKPPQTPEQKAHAEAVAAHQEGLKKRENLIEKEMGPVAYAKEKEQAGKPLPGATYVPSAERTAAEKEVDKTFQVPTIPRPATKPTEEIPDAQRLPQFRKTAEGAPGTQPEAQKPTQLAVQKPTKVSPQDERAENLPGSYSTKSGGYFGMETRDSQGNLTSPSAAFPIDQWLAKRMQPIDKTAPKLPMPQQPAQAAQPRGITPDEQPAPGRPPGQTPSGGPATSRGLERWTDEKGIAQSRPVQYDTKTGRWTDTTGKPIAGYEKGKPLGIGDTLAYRPELDQPQQPGMPGEPAKPAEPGLPSEPAQPGLPGEPAKPADQGGGGEMTQLTQILTEIKTSIDNLANKVGVA